MYSLTIFLSSFLLFIIQPVIGKQLLPLFGGGSGSVGAPGGCGGASGGQGKYVNGSSALPNTGGGGGAGRDAGGGGGGSGIVIVRYADP